MKTYIEKLKAFSEGEATKKTGASHVVPKNNSRINNDWRPIEEQIIMLMRSLPETERNRNWTMNDLVLQLYGKYNQRPHPMHVGKALRRLGWKKLRDWSAAGEGRRFWLPNGRIDSYLTNKRFDALF